MGPLTDAEQAKLRTDLRELDRGDLSVDGAKVVLLWLTGKETLDELDSADYETIINWVGRDWETGQLEPDLRTIEELGGVLYEVKQQVQHRYAELHGMMRARFGHTPEEHGIPTMSQLVDRIKQFERKLDIQS